MTPRERAKEATREAGLPDWGSDDQEQLEMAVEQAIVAAEEAKEKEVRDACAQIVHEVYLAWVDGDWAPGEAFESAKEKIRFGGRT